MHPALWMITQLTSQVTHPDMFINIRAIHNRETYVDDKGTTRKNETEVMYNENIRVGDFHSRWHDDLLNRLTVLNESPSKPCNIYYGVNCRTKPGSSNSKDDVVGYQAFYLDLDDNKNYTKAQRIEQIEFWKAVGLEPSFVVDSGHGYHAYWLLTGIVTDKERGQACLKEMVRLSGCRDKGNTHDVTRVLRLPGFVNTKNWWNGDSPLCVLVDPPEWESIAHDGNLRYDLESFEHFFPASELENIQYYQAKAAQSGEMGTINERIRTIAQEAAQQRIEQARRANGTSFNNAQDVARAAKPIINGPSTDVIAPWSPSLKSIPPLSDLKFKKGRAWMKKYCSKGWDGLDDTTKNEIGRATNMDNFSASELDFRVIYFLVESGYTYEAVNEFWRRPEIRLFREEKFQKNPNYLDVSYEKALEQVRSSITGDNARARPEPKPPEIYVNSYNTFVVRPNGVDQILTGELILTARYYDEDAAMPIDREWFEVRALCMHEGEIREYTRLLPAIAFSSTAEFKRHGCGEGVRCVTDSAKFLQMLMNHLEKTYKNVPVKKFHSKIIYKDNRFIFPTFVVSKTGVAISEDVSLTAELKLRYPIYKWFATEFMPTTDLKPFVQAHWAKVLKIHLPSLVLSIMGTIASSAFKAIIEEKLKVEDFNLPTINVRGSSVSGKSETLRQLLKLACISGGKSALSTKSSMFGLQRMFSMTNFVPMMIDEFKLQTDGKNAYELDAIRTLVRRIYSGESMLRGKASLEVDNTSLHCPLIVSGEHNLERVGDVSEISRIIPIQTDSFDPEANITNFLDIQDLKLNLFAPHFYHWLLNQDHEALYAQFKELKKQIISDLSTSFAGEKMRVGHNLAALWFGTRLWDGFIKSIDDSAPTCEATLYPQKNLVEMIKNWAIESQQSLVIREEHKEAKVVANNEAISMLMRLSELVESQDEIISEAEERRQFWYEELDGFLYLKFSSAYSLYCKVMRRESRAISEPSKIKRLFLNSLDRNEGWLTNNSALKKLRGTTHRVMVFNLKKIQEMGVWAVKLNLENSVKKINDGDFLL